LKKLKEEHPTVSTNPFEGYLDPKTNKFSYDVLKSSFPKGVKPDHKECYLEEDVF